MNTMRLSAVVLLTLALAAAPARAQWEQGGAVQGSGSLEAPPGSAKNPVAVRAEFTPPTGSKLGQLSITVTIQPGWHIYSITQPTGGPIATKIEVALPQGVRLTDAFKPSVAPEKTKEPDAFGDLDIESHHGTVTWSAPIELAAGTDPAKLRINGKLTVQPCDADSCMPPQDIAFSAKLGAGMTLPQPASQAATASGGSVKGGGAAFDPKALVVAENDQIKQTSMAVAVLMGFLGGVILNLMPCVLPVIGLKILSFVEQSGHDRRRALVLNIWYSLGLLSVFLVLATLAVTLGLGWGQLFSFNGFNISLTAVVFAMGLSFLGVWEIPIPGFVGRGKAVELAGKEGGAGAFAKGVLTTILATPCSAPFLATALAWAVVQPPYHTYIVFTAVGLGMASPYLLIGAFPKLIAFLPKPGAWMDTFKQIMGFVLLGTVVFLLTFIPWPLVVPTFAFLIGLWVACWWIGRTPPTADTEVQARAWFVALAIGGAAWLLAFGWLADVMQGYFDRTIEQTIATRMAKLSGGDNSPRSNMPAENGSVTSQNDRLPWQPFTRKMLDEATAAGLTVLVDFTADWCLTCKTLEAAVLNTREIRDAVQANRVLALHADWTHGEPEVTAMLELLGSKQVPVLAIFPAGNPNRPIVLRGGYTRQTLLDALKLAGPSKTR